MELRGEDDPRARPRTRARARDCRRGEHERARARVSTIPRASWRGVPPPPRRRFTLTLAASV
eukprot:629100-Pleurochrysis_carterae.AAC.2